MEGRELQRRGGTEGALPPRQDERPRARRELQRRYGERSRVSGRRNSRFHRGIAALLLLAPAFIASPAPAQTSDDRAAIRNLLETRAEAILGRDRELFLSTIASGSHIFRARQVKFFSQVSKLPLESYRLIPAWHRSGDLVRPSDRTRYVDAQDVSIPLTEERYRIRGYDRLEAVEDQYFTFVNRDGRWLIANDTDLEDLSLRSGRHLWDFGSVEQQQRGRLLQLAHPHGPRSHDFLGLAQSALQRVDRFWTAPWDRDMVLLIPDDVSELERILQTTFDLDDFVAFAYSSVDISRDLEYSGHRIILNPEAFAGRSEETVTRILAHEMLHVASRYVSGPFVPIFVDEGIADFVGNAGDPSGLDFFESEIAAGRFDGALPEDFEFTVGSGTDIFRSYQEAQSAVRFFVDRWGIKEFVRFYRELGSRKVAPGTANFHLSRALKKVTGLDLDGFEREWADSIN